MEIKREWIEELIFESEPSRRFTQDSPVLPDVWIKYGEKLTKGKDAALDLLLTPHSSSTAGELYKAVRNRLETERGPSGGWRQLRSPNGYMTKLVLQAKSAADKESLKKLDEECCNPEKDAVPGEPAPENLAYNQSTVVACLYFDELVRVLLPLTDWWSRNVCSEPGRATVANLSNPVGREAIEAALERIEAGQREVGGPVDLLWLVKLVGGILVAAETKIRAKSWDARRKKWDKILKDESELARAFRKLVLAPPGPPLDCPEWKGGAPLYMVSRNRKARPTVAYSVQAVKADAARRVFQADCSALAWAILDSGIDAEHPAFRRRDDQGRMHRAPHVADPPHNQTRIRATFDFTRVRLLLSGSARQLRAEADRIGARAGKAAASLDQARKRLEDADERTRAGLEAEIRQLEGLHAGLTKQQERWAAYAEEDAVQDAATLKEELLTGMPLNWARLYELLEIRHEPGLYIPPVHEHGTHVAGILAADWQQADWEKDRPEDPDLPERPTTDLVGICPDISLYDFRVFNQEGDGDEFTVMAALQFLRFLNAHRELPLIHGANLSLAIRHDVANYACGRTPVCDECDRVVSSGVVVVAAAGNYGYHRFSTVTDAGAASVYEGYSDISITDPGNADSVITVGSTHRIEPHTYGVSYFSSRGPTGDGRYKPDLVAPGEKILAPIPGNAAKIKDGTSMAAPHVSGAAAMILGRHREFIGRPARIKQILCSTATDLGRDRYFQGAGMVDVLRAMQSV